MSTLTLKEVISFLSDVENTTNRKSIDLPQLIRKKINQRVSYDALNKIYESLNLNIRINKSENELKDEVFAIDRKEFVGNWNDVKYFCFLNKNGISCDVYGLDDSGNPIVSFANTVDVGLIIQGQAQPQPMPTSFCISSE